MAHPEVHCWTVFLIEDNSADAALCREALHERPNVHCEIYADPTRAFDSAVKNATDRLRPPPDLILVDLNVPQAPEADVVHRIKHSEPLCHLPVVGTSSRVSPTMAERFYRGGGNCLVSIPLESAGILHTYEAIFDFWLEVPLLPERVTEAVPPSPLERSGASAGSRPLA